MPKNCPIKKVLPDKLGGRHSHRRPPICSRCSTMPVKSSACCVKMVSPCGAIVAVRRSSGWRCVTEATDMCSKTVIRHYSRMRSRRRPQGGVLPVIWPINDLKDQQQLRFTDLWAAFAGPVKIASRRYSKGPVIVGRLSWTGSVWKGDWSLFVDNSAYSWSLSGSDYNTRDRRWGRPFRRQDW